MSALATDSFPPSNPPGPSPTIDGIGYPAPDFELADADGNPYRLRDHLAPGGTVVVFFRGHWCPYCRRYLCKLQSNLPRFQQLGAALIAISPEPSGTSAALVRELGLGFPVLSDADGRVINRYGTRNGFLGGSSVLPHPSVFVLDRLGVLRFRSIDRNFKKRTTVRAIFAALGGGRVSGVSSLA
ncbi:MAG TPA: peroxiredoxin family protein [Humisphaera sp.]